MDIDIISAVGNQLINPLDSSMDGITIKFANECYAIEFKYHSALNQLVKLIPGCTFNTDAKCWTAPISSYEALKKISIVLRRLSCEIHSAEQELVAWAQQEHPNKQLKKAFIAKDTSYIGQFAYINQHFAAFAENIYILRVHDAGSIENCQFEVGKQYIVTYKFGKGIAKPI